jgi:HEAT repeat protein
MVQMSAALIRRDMALSDPDLVAQGLRRIVRWLGTDAEHRRPAEFAERKAELADLEPRLLQLSEHEDDVLRELAADALGAWQGEAALERLIALAQDGQERVRASAVAGLESWPHSPAARSLLLASAVGGHWTVRMQAVRALGAFGGDDVLDTLLEGLLDPDSFVRWAAAASLRRHPGEAYRARLRQLVDSPSPHLLDAAIDLLGDVGNAEDGKFLADVGGWFNLAQPKTIRAWARKAAKNIRTRMR